MQNHMFMLLALIAIEPPTSLEGEAIRNEKVKLLKSIRRTTPEEALKNTVRGQYGEGIVIEEPPYFRHRRKSGEIDAVRFIAPEPSHTGDEPDM